MRRILSILIFLFVPQIAFAFMDAPTVTATFPTYLVILVPFVAYEVAYISRKLNVPKLNVLKAGILIHLIALVTMVLGGWLHSYVRDHVMDAIHLKTTGIFTVLRDPPSVLDVIFSLSIGSVVLIQDSEYRWLNLIQTFEKRSISVLVLPSDSFSGMKLDRSFGITC